MSRHIAAKQIPEEIRTIKVVRNPITGRFVQFGSKTYKEYFGASCEGIESVEFNPNQYQKDLADYYYSLETLQGIILYWSLGSGKTCGAITIMDIIIGRLLQNYRLGGMRKYFDIVKGDPVPRVNFVTPGSLSQNFWYEYCSRCGQYKEYAPYFNYIIYNAYKAPNQLKDPNALAYSIIIIDEAHNIIRGKINGSEEVYVKEYDTIMEAKHRGAVVIALTGTPILRTDSMYYLFNLVANEQDEYTSINEYIQEMFLTDDGIWTYTPKALLRIGPYISRVKKSGTIEEGVPETEEVMIPVPITSPEQLGTYMSVKSGEVLFYPNPQLKYKDPEKYKLQKQRFYLALSMKRSRAALNMVYPRIPEEYIRPLDELLNLDPDAFLNKYGEEPNDLYSFRNRNLWVDEKSKDDDERFEEFMKGLDYLEAQINRRIRHLKFIKVPWVIPSFTQELQKYAPKMLEVLSFIYNNLDFKHAVYSEFKTKSGVYILGALLSLYGIKVAYFTGDLTEEKRVQIIADFNDASNAYGSKIKVLLLSKAGGEGQTFKDVRYLHILEQSIDELAIDQIKGRFVRLGSHSNLPIEDRKVTIRRYFGTRSYKNIDLEKLTFEDIMKKYYNLLLTSDFEAYAYGVRKKDVIKGLVDSLDVFGTVYTYEMEESLLKRQEEYTKLLEERLKEENITPDAYADNLENFFEMEDPLIASQVGTDILLDTIDNTTVPFVTLDKEINTLNQELESLKLNNPSSQTQAT